MTTTFDMLCSVEEEIVEVDWYFNELEMNPSMTHFDKLEFISEGRDRIIR